MVRTKHFSAYNLLEPIYSPLAFRAGKSDDIAIFSKHVEAQFEQITGALTPLLRAGLTVKLKKCHSFFQTTCNLGHVIHFWSARNRTANNLCDLWLKTFRSYNHPWPPGKSSEALGADLHESQSC